MKYAHCRRCSRSLETSYSNPETEDGVCLDCTDRLVAFERTLPQQSRVPDSTLFWRTPAWSVLIDQWLEAGAP